MATTTTHHVQLWDTFHNNGPFPTKILFDTRLAPSHTIPSRVDRYNDAALEIRRLIKDSVTSNERFRAFGSAWSLSNIAHQRDRMHFNARMNIKLEVAQTNLHTSTQYKHQNLFFFECGNTIKEISRFVFDKGKSLKTSGASNGQTIAGAISTGVHGSAIDVGSIQDYVVGLNLIIGSEANDIVYLERHTKPALNNQFASTIKARVIRNDGLFYAALVGLGSFGFVHGVVIETEDLFLLKRYTKRITKNQAIELAENMNFGTSSFKIDSEVDANGNGTKPYHFKVYINPYNNSEDYIAEVIYKKPYQAGYPDPIPTVKTAVYKELPDFMSRLAAKHNWLIPKIIQALRGTLFPKLDIEVIGTLGEIFWDSIHQGPAFAVTMGINNKDTKKALDLFVNLANVEGPVPGAMALRFVKASSATLAFTKYPITCVLEMDGILWKDNENIISLKDFCRRIIEVFKSAGIAFTMHWGKNADWSFPGLVDYMYGNTDDVWKDHRSALLTKQMADIFSNSFLDAVKLSDYRGSVPVNLIASLDTNGNPDIT